jgi:hypothetical protein
MNKIDLENLISTLSADTTKTASAETTEQVVAPTAAPEAEKTAETTENELQKVAAEMDAAGRVMARAFVDEISKLAVSSTGMVASEADIPENSVTVDRTPTDEADVDKAVAIINQLTEGERNHGPQGYIQVNGQPVAQTGAHFMENDEIPSEAAEAAAEAAEVKQGSVSPIVSKLYTNLFGEN